MTKTKTSFVLLFFMTSFIYAQDYLLTSDFIILKTKIDSLERLFNEEKNRVDSLYMNSYMLQKAKFIEYQISKKIDETNNLYENVKILNKQANRAIYNEKKYEILIKRSSDMKKYADSMSSVLCNNFPLSCKINSNSNKETFGKSKNIIKCAGIFQLLTGTTAFILTIADANTEEKITTEVPKFNSKEMTKESLTIKHEWNMSHTIFTILSGGLIISGIITINF